MNDLLNATCPDDDEYGCEVGEDDWLRLLGDCECVERGLIQHFISLINEVRQDHCLSPKR